MKRNEQMYAMLSMAVSLFPTRIDDHVHSNLREKYGERMLKMQVGNHTCVLCIRERECLVELSVLLGMFDINMDNGLALIGSVSFSPGWRVFPCCDACMCILFANISHVAPYDLPNAKMNHISPFPRFAARR